MKLKKFYANSPREALRLVRAQLGDSALILSNRSTATGVEIVAVSAEEMQAVTAAVAPPRRRDAAGAAQRPAADEQTRNRPAPSAQTAQRASVPARSSAATPDREQTGSLSRAAHRVETAYATWPSDAAERVSDASEAAAYGKGNDATTGASAGFDLVHEVRVLRSLVEGQLSAIAWAEFKRRDATRLEIARRLLQAGFGMKLARELADELPDGLELAKAMRLVKARLQQLLPMPSPPGGMVERGGVYALVGPTGVGKTTTVAKVAAQCALRFGTDQLALVTTDSYRIGAVDQLRIYGRILNVPVFSIRDQSDLRKTLSDLQSRRLVLIDTIGMSQRDRGLAEQIALLSGAGQSVQRVLLLSAVAQPAALEEVVRAYRAEPMLGCILTKVDEAPSLGAALDVLVRHRLTLHYVTNGQRVPEDLHAPNALYLVERALRSAAGAAGAESSDAEDLLMAAARI